MEEKEYFLNCIILITFFSIKPEGSIVFKDKFTGTRLTFVLNN